MLCTAHAVLVHGQTPSPPSDLDSFGSDFGSDSEDLFAPSKRQDPTWTTLYKFKNAGVSFCHVQDLLFSLHSKSGLFYVECTRIVSQEASSSDRPPSLTCVQPCLIKADLAPNSGEREKSAWITALLTRNVIEKKLGAPVPPGHVVVFVKMSGHPTRYLTLNPLLIQNHTTSSLNDLRRPDLDLERLTDVFFHFFQAHTVPSRPPSNPADSVQFLFDRGCRANLGLHLDHFPAKDLEDVQPFHRGLLLLSKDGKLWHRCLKDEAETQLIPIPNCHLISVYDQREASVLNRDGYLYHFSLPFVAKDAEANLVRVRPGENLNRELIFGEIVDALNEVHRAHEVLSRQDEVLEQLRVVETLKSSRLRPLFRARSSVKPFSGLGISVTYEADLEIENVSPFAFKGRYWFMNLKLESKNRPRLHHHQVASLPPHFGTGDLFCASVLIPKEFTNQAALPVCIEVDLVFQTDDHEDSPSIWHRSVLECELNSVHFLRIETSARRSTHRLDPFVTESVQPRQTRKIKLSLDRDLIDRSFNHLIFFDQMSRDLKNSPSFSCQTLLFDSELSASVKLSDDCATTAGVVIKFAGESKHTLVTIFRDFERLKLSSLLDQKSDHVKVPKSVISAANYYLDELGYLSDEEDLHESEEHKARLRKIYPAIRSEITLQLP